jgi:RNA-directed DNA polymerase
LRDKGIPQGGVISPLLMNLFMHYVFDQWMKKHIPNVPFCRYADDGLLHCSSYNEAIHIMTQLERRFSECGLSLHPDKTKIFYCQDINRKQKYNNVSFDFLGYTFRPRSSNDKYGRRFINFLPGASRTALKAMKQTIRRWKIQLKSDKSIDDISRMFVPVLRGWSNYYGRFYKSIMATIWKHFDYYIMRWAMHKYKRFRGHKTRAIRWLRSIAKIKCTLFPHWKIGFLPWVG